MIKNQKFEDILDAEGGVLEWRMALAILPEMRKEEIKQAKKRLSDMVDALSEEEMTAFGEYRKHYLSGGTFTEEFEAQGEGEMTLNHTDAPGRATMEMALEIQNTPDAHPNARAWADLYIRTYGDHPRVASMVEDAPAEGTEDAPKSAPNGKGTARKAPASATEKQVAYITSLAKTYEGKWEHLIISDKIRSAVKGERITKRTAGEIIDILLSIKENDRTRGQAKVQATAPIAKDELEPGIYVKDGRYYKVVMGRAGYLYVVGGDEKGEFNEYLARRPLFGSNRLTPGDKLTLEDAMRFGKVTGRCICCGRELTNATSIARGIGPICAERF